MDTLSQTRTLRRDVGLPLYHCPPPGYFSQGYVARLRPRADVSANHCALKELGAIAGVCPAMDARRKKEVSRCREEVSVCEVCSPVNFTLIVVWTPL